jgi:hypothetical protein
MVRPALDSSDGCIGGSLVAGAGLNRGDLMAQILLFMAFRKGSGHGRDSFRTDPATTAR